MAASENQIVRLAEHLHQARSERRETGRLTESDGAFDVATAYRIQAHGIALRLKAGELRSGMKMGLTSEAKRKQMNLDSPVYGVLTDKMFVKDGGSVRVSDGIHPKAEPEIAFGLKHAIRGRLSYADAAAAVDWVSPAIEILDSRYKGFKYFSLEDVIADNSSSYLYVIGAGRRPLKGMDLKGVDLVLKVNGVEAQRGKGEAISGDPLLSLVQLGELCERHGEKVEAGQVVLAGAATVAVALESGQRIELDAGPLGPVSFSVGT